jgi:DNA polymerase-3 subunit gamma/tau
MKDLLSTIPQSPANGRFKIYLLDEAHMLTTESFNALLKSLEEPPKHVVFILATTNPEKLPKTVQSRCLQLNLKTVGKSTLSNHLKMILESEEIAFDQDSVDLISDAASGSVRDALTLLDQAIAHGNGVIKLKNIKQLLGTIDNSYLISMLTYIINGDGPNAFDALLRIEELTSEHETILKNLISIIHQLSLEKALNNSNDNDIKNLSRDIDEEFCQLLYEIAVNTYSKFNAHPSPKEALEICILRMIAFNPIHKINESSTEEKKNLKKHNTTKLISPNKSLEIDKNKHHEISPETNKPQPENLNTIESSDDWLTLFDLLPLSPFARNYFGQLSFNSFNKKQLTLNSPDDNYKIPENVFDEFNKVFSDYFGTTISIEIEKGSGSASDSPIKHKKMIENNKQSGAEKDILSDKSIQEFLHKFDGKIKNGSIKPID